MEDADNVYSERTLRYGRNINFLCFIALAMILMDVDLNGANLFGAKTSEQNIWRVLFILIAYHFVTFQYIGRIDWKLWLQALPVYYGEATVGFEDRLKMSDRRSKLYHWSLFINKKKVPKSFLKKDHKAVTLHFPIQGEIYGWVIESEDFVHPHFGGATTIDKEFFKKFRANYWRWLLLEFGLPTVLAFWAFAKLIGKMEFDLWGSAMNETTVIIISIGFVFLSLAIAFGIGKLIEMPLRRFIGLQIAKGLGHSVFVILAILILIYSFKDFQYLGII